MRALVLVLSLSLPAAADSIHVVSGGTPPIREGALAISPTNPRVVLAAAIGGTGAPRADVHTFRSTDGGVTWSSTGILPKQLGTTAVIGHWDPVLAFDRTGRAFLTVVAAVGEAQWRIAVYRSHDDGTTWTGVDVASPAVSRNDKPWIAIDDLGGVHVVWYGLGTNGTSYAFSRDGGLTFSAPRVFPAFGWPFVAAGLEGDVYVTHPGSFGNWDILRSPDRGMTFGPETRIASTGGSLPHMVAADRTNVYAFMPGTDGVYFSRSTDRGSSWSQPLKFGGPAGAFLPSVAVDPITGEVVLAWQERASTSQARVMTTSSIDGGATFGTPRAVTALFAATRANGEYNQLAAYGGLHIIVWSDDAGLFSAARLDAAAPVNPTIYRRRRAVRR
jgi:hypothetical protein